MMKKRSAVAPASAGPAPAPVEDASKAHREDRQGGEEGRYQEQLRNPPEPAKGTKATATDESAGAGASVQEGQQEEEPAKAGNFVTEAAGWAALLSRLVSGKEPTI
uniref:Uncharacterized protein n=1 Tax=Odontella aurita TaxID=265563 RepID=A0A7S4N764_9STRA|mmetsp:Transcript_5008/g.14370  ORF Transcript_5008/g.14370 Transcript_5008/m.14370 type:complete len:106 (+) Transcript_5008:153-470(+)